MDDDPVVSNPEQRTLLLLRHAKSDWSGSVPDFDRPLAERGRTQAPLAGRWLASRSRIDLAIVSPARRARETWELASAELEPAPRARFLDERLSGIAPTDIDQINAMLQHKLSSGRTFLA